MNSKVIRLRSGRQGFFTPGHPWVYKSQLLKVDSSIEPADVVSVVDSQGKFFGRGYYNPKSEISIRILTFKDEPVDKALFDRRISEAVKKRSSLLQKTNAYRIIFSEADGLPGLIADIYHDTVVFQILTLGMEKFKPLLVSSIDRTVEPKHIYEKSASPFRKLEGLKDEARWWTDKGESIIEIFEGKVKFLVDIENGHKTGFYLDQRRSRMAMEPISRDKKVLDLFCYTGGFAVSAAVYGAKKAVANDIKPSWLELGGRNAELNGVVDKVEFIKGDAFTILKEIHNSSERFDIIIIDPPSFLKEKRSIASASRGYKELNLLAMKTLVSGGILATFSCSYNMPNEIFAGIIKEAAKEAKREYAILKRCHQAKDHSIVKAIPETEYLKGYFLRLKQGMV